MKREAGRSARVVREVDKRVAVAVAARCAKAVRRSCVLGGTMLDEPYALSFPCGNVACGLRAFAAHFACRNGRLPLENPNVKVPRYCFPNVLTFP